MDGSGIRKLAQARIVHTQQCEKLACVEILRFGSNLGANPSRPIPDDLIPFDSMTLKFTDFLRPG